VLPGYVGGRMVKWLSKIKITKDESKNWHHYYGFGTHHRDYPPRS
jgi:nitrate reductase (NAD(P)H)